MPSGQAAMQSPVSAQPLAHARATCGPSPKRTISSTPAITAFGARRRCRPARSPGKSPRTCRIACRRRACRPFGWTAPVQRPFRSHENSKFERRRRILSARPPAGQREYTPIIRILFRSAILVRDSSEAGLLAIKHLGGMENASFVTRICGDSHRLEFCGCRSCAAAVTTARLRYADYTSAGNESRCRAQAKAKEIGQRVVITIVGPSGDLIYFTKMDGAQYGSIDISQKKARAAAKFRRPTKIFEDLLAKGGGFLSFLTLPDVIASAGGLPIVEGGKIIGAIGVSGSPNGTIDAEASQAGLDALK